MVAEAIGLALERAGIEVIARASTVAAALAHTRGGKPDVVLLDRRLPDGDGTALIPELVQAGVRVLVLTGEATASIAARVAEAGGAGLILKSARLDELVEAVRRVADGEVVFDQKLLGGVLDRLSGRIKFAGATLTAREQETLLLLADGAGTESQSG